MNLGMDVFSKKINARKGVIDEKHNVSVKSSCIILNTKNGVEDLEHWIFKHQKETFLW